MNGGDLFSTMKRYLWENINGGDEDGVILYTLKDHIPTTDCGYPVLDENEYSAQTAPSLLLCYKTLTMLFPNFSTRI